MLRLSVAFLAVAGSIDLCMAQELRLRSWLSDHMVLPQATEVPFIGTAAPGAQVVVSAPWLDSGVMGRAGADGVFRIGVPTPQAGGPHELRVRAAADEVVVRDVLVGDVWLGSGQSNMEMTVGDVGGWRNGVLDWEQEVAAADYPQMRVFTVAQHIGERPVDDVRGEWKVCTPENAGAFSAVCYFFGREVLQRRGEPLGLVVSSWGGTVCEAWASAEGLADFPEFASAIARLTDPNAVLDQDRTFWAAVARTDPANAGAGPMSANFDASNWDRVAMPDVWSRRGLGDFDGVGWYRRVVDIPDAWVGKDLLLTLGPIDDMDSVWFQGRRVGGREEPGHWNRPRDYRIPGKEVRAGEAVLAVRVVDTGGEGGFTAQAEALRLVPVEGGVGNIGLAGPWQFHRGTPMSGLPPPPRGRNRNPNTATILYNGMIAPLVDLPIRGVLWYQGESNRGRAEQYQRLFPAMISDWRRLWGRELPFLFVQIAPYGYGGDTGQAFDLRCAQAVALQLPETGMVVSADVGNPRDIHPKDKQTIGHRLALQAMNKVYADSGVVCDGPRAVSAERDGAALRVQFAHSDGGLRTAAGGSKQFELAGKDGRFHPAVGQAEGSVVVVRSGAVAEPAAVRYCHGAAVAGDLCNGEGLPAGPFLLKIE
ncbi:MAG: sialate O-acetylesterase [Planctomycetota bacterium]|nr:sialate O-acetylesterase [Planctomycetota bacterium]